MSGTPGRAGGPIAYVMSRFPKLTETFVLFEILALEEQGVDVRVYPLLRERQPLIHPEASSIVGRARYLPFFSRRIMASNLLMLAGRPRAYLGSLLTLVRETLGSANYLLGGLAIFPKVVHMAEEMERQGIRHVHCHFSNHPATAGFVIHRLTGIPFSFTAHGSDLHVDRHMLCRKVAESEFAVAISEFNRRVIHETCGAIADQRVMVIHCGVDTAVFAPARGDGAAPEPSSSQERSEAVDTSDTGPFSVLAIGTLHEVKGFEYLVESCRLLAEAGVDFVCRIVGDGPAEANLRRLVEDRGIADRVRFEGRRTRVEIAARMEQADVLVAPSVPTKSGRREGIPVVLMEAMACGLPVIASRISGIPELVEHGVSGLLIEPRDATALAAAIQALRDDPALRARLGTAGRERVIRDFDVRQNAALLRQRIFDDPAPTTGSGRVQ